MYGLLCFQAYPIGLNPPESHRSLTARLPYLKALALLTAQRLLFFFHIFHRVLEAGKLGGIVNKKEFCYNGPDIA